MDNRKKIRNIGIFVFVSLTSGWFGLLIDKFIKNPSNEESLGMGIGTAFNSNNISQNICGGWLE